MARRIDKVFKAVKALNVKDGDVIVFKVDPNAFPPDQLHQKIQAVMDDLHAKLTTAGIRGVTFLATGPGHGVENLSEADMNANGWFRKGL